MQAWAKDQGVKTESLLTLFGDPHADLTKALEMQLTHPGPVKGKGLVNRCKRCAYVQLMIALSKPSLLLRRRTIRLEMIILSLQWLTTC